MVTDPDARAQKVRQMNRYDWITSVFIPDLDADFVPHVGKRIAVVVDGSTPQVTMLAMCLRNVEHEGWSLTLASPIVAPTFPPPTRFSVLDERWETIGAPARVSQDVVNDHAPERWT